MEWIADMYGPHFLLLYGTVIVLTLGASWWVLRSMDPSRSMSTPTVPFEPDPYEVAYLSGGTVQVMRTLLVSLRQRGYLRVVTNQFGPGEVVEHAPDHPDADHLSTIEREAFEMFRTPRKILGISGSRLLTPAFRELCSPYERRTRDEAFVVPPVALRAALALGLAGSFVILGLGAYKVSVALEKGRYNVIFLLVMAIVGFVALAMLCTRRVSSRGRNYLNLLKSTFRGVPSKEGPEEVILPMIVGLYGLSMLVDTPYASYAGMFGKKKTDWGGGCGGGCGGCGGGCGGCGG